MFDVRSLFAALRRPRPPADAYGRGVAALEAGDHADALAALDEALQSPGAAPGGAAAHNKRGVALVGLERRGEALRAFCAALACDERHAPALVNLGNLLLEDGHAQDALDYYESALRIDERYAPAHRNLAVALRQLGRRAEAVRALRRAARFDRRSARS